METFASVSEGFDERLDAYAAQGYTHYFYSPSDDRYCNSWGWKFVYNDSDRHMVRSYAELCKKKGLQFVWTINPGSGYAWDDKDYEYLLNKLVMMYYNGIRSFALNFSTDNPAIKSVKERLMTDFVETRKGKVRLYILNDMAVVNYPASSDIVRTLVNGYYFSDDFNRKSKAEGAVVCNLSVNDDFARFALISVADYAKDPSKYSPESSLINGVHNLPATAEEAFVTFLRHLRGAVVPDAVPQISDMMSEDEVFAEFDKISSVRKAIGDCTDETLMNTLEPYLLQFDRFGKYGHWVKDCLNSYKSSDYENFWRTYISYDRSFEDAAMQNEYPVGDARLHEYCKTLMDTMLSTFTSRYDCNKAISASNVSEVSDGNLLTSLPADGDFQYAIPPLAETCHLLLGKLPDKEPVYVRQLGTDGRLVAELLLTSSCSTFYLKHGAVKIDILGNVDIYELIFVSL